MRELHSTFLTLLQTENGYGNSKMSVFGQLRLTWPEGSSMREGKNGYWSSNLAYPCMSFEAPGCVSKEV
jgi:hypothetical protein